MWRCGRKHGGIEVISILPLWQRSVRANGKRRVRGGREGEGAKRDVHSPFASGELKGGKKICPKYLTLLKVLRRGLQFALLTGRGLLLQVLQREKGTNQNRRSPQTDPWRGRVWGHVFVPEWLCFLKSSSPLRTDRLFWHFVLSPRSRMKGCSCLQTYKHFQEVATSLSSCILLFLKQTQTGSGWVSMWRVPLRYPSAGSEETDSDTVLKCAHVRLTPLTVGALVGLGFASFAVGGGGVRGGAGAATVFLFHWGWVSDGALVAVVVCRNTEPCCSSDVPRDIISHRLPDSVSPPTVHVHHPRRRAVLRSRQLGAVLLIFALLLVLVLLQRQKKETCSNKHILTSNVVKYKYRNQSGGLTSSDLGSVTGTHL